MFVGVQSPLVFCRIVVRLPFIASYQLPLLPLYPVPVVCYRVAPLVSWLMICHYLRVDRWRQNCVNMYTPDLETSCNFYCG